MKMSKKLEKKQNEKYENLKRKFLSLALLITDPIRVILSADQDTTMILLWVIVISTKEVSRRVTRTPRTLQWETIST